LKQEEEEEGIVVDALLDSGVIGVKIAESGLKCFLFSYSHFHFFLIYFHFSICRTLGVQD